MNNLEKSWPKCVPSLLTPDEVAYTRIMNVESDRQWFVYFKETEMGPFPETELVQKIKSGGFDGSAFVYTDGMSDWELIKDSALKSYLESETAPVTVVESIAAAEPKAAVASPTVAAESAPTVKKSFALGLKPIAAVLFVALVGTGYILNRDLINSYLGGAGEGIIDLSKETPLPQTVSLDAAQDTSINWGELDAFVRIQDPQGPAFRLANRSLGGMRPIFVGVLSPLHKYSYLTVAVFPDNDRSLYSIPPLWISDVGVQAGYFSVGPHVNKGQDLLPGRYRVLVASGGKFLGDVSVDIGEFPMGDALNEQKAKVLTEVTTLAGTEKEAFKAKAQSMVGLFQKLGALEAAAMAGATQRKVWVDSRGSLTKDLAAMRDEQTKLLQGPMFYPGEQNALLATISATDQYMQGLEAQSTGGAAEVKVKTGTTLPALKSAALAASQKLEAMLGDADKTDATKPLTISAENIKVRLLEESK